MIFKSPSVPEMQTRLNSPDEKNRRLESRNEGLEGQIRSKNNAGIEQRVRVESLEKADEAGAHG